MSGSLWREDTVPMRSEQSMQSTLRSDDAMPSLNVDETMDMTLRRDETVYMPSNDDVDAFGQYFHRDQTMNDVGTLRDERMQTVRAEDTMQCSTTVVDDYVQWRKRNMSYKSLRKTTLPIDDSIDYTINPTMEMDDTEHFQKWRQKTLASSLSVFAPQLISEKTSLVDPSLMETAKDEDFLAWRNRRQTTQKSDMPATLTSGLTLTSNCCSLDDDENKEARGGTTPENETLLCQTGFEQQLSEAQEYFKDQKDKMNSLELQMKHSESLQYSSLYSSDLSEIPLRIFTEKVSGSDLKTGKASESKHVENTTDLTGQNVFISRHLRPKMWSQARTDASQNLQSSAASVDQPNDNPSTSSEENFLLEASVNDSECAFPKVKPNITKPFCCGVCDKTFTSCSHLRHHVRIHIGTGSHKCTICDSSFLKFRELEEHLLIHADEKRIHSCHICEKEFSAKQHLKSHLLTHSEHEREHCSLGLLKANELQSHQKGLEMEKLFPCSLCDLTFARTGDWRRHMRRNHPEDQPIKCKQSSLAAVPGVDGDKHRASHTK